MKKLFRFLERALPVLALVFGSLAISLSVIAIMQEHTPRISVSFSTKGEWLCINGLAYEFSEYGTDKEFGDKVEILEAVLEPKGSIQYHQGKPMPRRTGPKACAH